MTIFFTLWNSDSILCCCPLPPPPRGLIILVMCSSTYVFLNFINVTPLAWYLPLHFFPHNKLILFLFLDMQELLLEIKFFFHEIITLRMTCLSNSAWLAQLEEPITQLSQ